MYILKFAAFSGLSYECARGDLQECRGYAARLIRLRRRRGHLVTCNRARNRGSREWEISEPEGCALVPDTAGMLYLCETFEYECPECGQGYDDREDAARCCAFSPGIGYECQNCGMQYADEDEAAECCE